VVQEGDRRCKKSTLNDLAYLTPLRIPLMNPVKLYYCVLPHPSHFSLPSTFKAGSLKMNTALEYSTRVVQEGGRRCKKSTLNDLVHLTPLRIALMNPPLMTANNRGDQ
jgi:hypothetical protein